jgi:hypothetical protein
VVESYLALTFYSKLRAAYDVVLVGRWCQEIFIADISRTYFKAVYCCIG